MRRIMTVFIAMALVAGCAKDGKLILSNIPNNCGSVGHTVTWIKYGDSHLGALALSDIGRNAEWHFRLIPDRAAGPVSYTDAVVTISPKTPVTPNNSWVNVSGKHSTDPVLKLCVPTTLAVGTDVEYMIDVQWVGELDPRAEVVR